MIGIDTNVLVRHVVCDDAEQTDAAGRLAESQCTAESPGIVPLVVLCELVWVLVRGYRYRRAEVAGVVRKLLAAQDLHVACAKGADVTWTFDRKTSGSGLFRQVGEAAR